MAPAPVPVAIDSIVDLNVPSNSLDPRSAQPLDISSTSSYQSLSEREFSSQSQPVSQSLERRTTDFQPLLQNHARLQARENVPIGHPNYSGAVDPNAINMKGIQALIAIIGAAFVLGAIWFFFWAKNGGFKFQKGDWDEYKSTVLRRKGPNGTTLSNASKSTRLGGGSIVGDGFSDRDTYADETSTVYTGTMTELSSSTAPIIKEKRAQNSKRARAVRAKEQKQREMAQAHWEGAHDDDVRAYMKEKPARVGGINRDSEALHYGTDYTDTESSVGYTASRPTSQHPRSYAQQPAAPRRTSRSPEKRDRNSRRDFSYTINGDATFSVASSERAPSPPPMRVPATAAAEAPRAPPHTSRAPRYHQAPAQGGRQVPGGYYAASNAGSGTSYTGTDYTQPLDFSAQHSQTKSYHHPIPGLSSGRGYRRDRGGDELDE